MLGILGSNLSNLVINIKFELLKLKLQNSNIQVELGVGRKKIRICEDKKKNEEKNRRKI